MGNALSSDPRTRSPARRPWSVTAALAWRQIRMHRRCPSDALPNLSGVKHDLHVHFVRAKAVRWVDLEWPGWVEVQPHEPDGTVVALVDKGPLFDKDDRLTAGTALPLEVEVPCDVLERLVDAAGNLSSLVRLRANVEDQSGRTIFRIDEHTLVWRA
jgi:hypothetical protein